MRRLLAGTGADLDDSILARSSFTEDDYKTIRRRIDLILLPLVCFPLGFQGLAQR